MADSSYAIAAIRDSRPPATDRFTYLTIVESHLSPEVLPTLNEVLQDAELTQEIGWDLVHRLAGTPGSCDCLETIARLGNPREVILKVLETLELLALDEGYETDTEGEKNKKAPTMSATQKFIVLLGMLAILHRRIKTKYPSRFLAQTLQTVYQTYRPSPNEEMTAAVINLVHNLSGRRRPPLPSRKSSVHVANPDQDGDPSKNAPDPEAELEREKPGQEELQQRLLLSFATCVLEAYVNSRDIAWAPRLVEFFYPEKIVPGTKTLMAVFREKQELLARDAMVGALAALTKDLGFQTCPPNFVEQLCCRPATFDPLAGTEKASSHREIALSTGGSICLLAYWIFSSTVFDADQPVPEMHIFPEHFSLLNKMLHEDVEARISGALGTTQALITVGLWLAEHKHVTRTPSAALSKQTSRPEDPTSEYMSCLHLVTLLAVFHPFLAVRNAAVILAGQVLHADPSDEDRLRIIDDLLENCMFASLKAQAITWLREELMAAPRNSSSVFSTAHALETVQYALFPDTSFLQNVPTEELRDWLAEHGAFLLQAANLGLFLWAGEKWRHVVPGNMGATVAERWYRPLRAAVGKVQGEEELLRRVLDMLGRTGEFSVESGGGA